MDRKLPTSSYGGNIDDMLKAVLTCEDDTEVINDTMAALTTKGFKLTKFMTSDDVLSSEIPVSDLMEKKREIIPQLSSKALGIMSDNTHRLIVWCTMYSRRICLLK